VADRSVAVRLLADVRGFIQGLSRADDRVQRFARSLAQSARDNADSFEAAGTALTGIGLAAGAGFGAAVAAAANFDQKMSGAAVATGAASDELARLRDAAKQVGADTVFSAGEAAEGITELGKAGLSTSDILGGALTGSTDLAAAGQIGLGEAAQFVAVTLKQFNLEGGRATDVADALTAGANLAVGEVGDLGQALAQSGQVSNQFGISMEETVGTLAAFANAGLLGSDAGTSLKTMLQRLANPSAEAATLMEQLGIVTFDASGEFVGIAGVADQLQGSLSGLTVEQRQSALATIFGSDAVRAASVLYSEGGASITRWTENVSQSGFAAQQAGELLDNLKGDIEALRGSLDTALIGTGEGAQGPLRETVQVITDLVNAYNDLPGPAQAAAGASLGVVGAVGLTGGALALAIPQLVSFYDSLGKLGRAGVGTQAAMRGLGNLLLGPVGIGLAAGAAALTLYAVEQQRAKARAEEFRETLDKTTGALTNNTRAMAINRLESEGALRAASELGISLELVADATLGDAEAVAQLNAVLDDIPALSKNTRSSLETLRGAMGEVNGEIENGVESQERIAAAMGSTRDVVEGLEGSFGFVAAASSDADTAAADTAGSIGDVGDAAEDADAALQGLIESFDDFAGVNLSARDAARGYEQALDDVQAEIDAQVEANGSAASALDVTTEAGRRSQAALDELATKANTSTESLLRLAPGTNAAASAALSARADFVKMAVQLGYTTEAAQVLAAQLIGLPPANIVVNNKAAIEAAERAQAAIDAIKGTTVDVLVKARYQGFKDAQLLARGYSAGGFVEGPGPKGVDSVLGVLAPGEGVLTASTVDRLGGKRAVDALNSGRPPGMDKRTSRPSGAVFGQGGGGTTVVQVDLRGAVVDRRRFFEELRAQIEQRGGLTTALGR
jgi:TP901 family phage tail tape measure protein